jgi:flagellar protein FlbD
VILVHRLKGEALFVNADLIESIEASPNTVLTLVDGRKAVVTETPEQVVTRIREYRASILVAAEEHRAAPAASASPLRVVRAES